MIKLDNSINCVKEKCTGCGLCVNKCPYNAIELQSNNEGFLYPIIEKEKCRNCGICKNNCPAINNSNTEYKNEAYKEKCYMGFSKNKEIYINSASGGFATVLANYVIESLNGVVYGCNLDTEGNVKHIRITQTEDLKKIQDSKYVQSEIVKIFALIKKDLQEKKALFIGTPCQVEAIKRYLTKEENNNLITCDLICHGVPSPVYFKKYIHFLRTKYNSNIDEYRFRNKTNFDKCGFISRIAINGRKKYIYTDNDFFYNDFLKEKNFRASCYNCKYKESKRIGDFTIGDVNSWEKYYDFYPEKASSLIIINNKEAEEIFIKLNKNIEYKEISLEDEKKLNKALSVQTPYPKERDTIYIKYNDFNIYEKENNKNIPIKQKIKNTLKKIIPFYMRIFFKKLKRKMK